VPHLSLCTTSIPLAFFPPLDSRCELSCFLAFWCAVRRIGLLSDTTVRNTRMFLILVMYSWLNWFVPRRHIPRVSRNLASSPHFPEPTLLISLQRLRYGLAFFFAGLIQEFLSRATLPITPVRVSVVISLNALAPRFFLKLRTVHILCLFFFKSARAAADCRPRPFFPFAYLQRTRRTFAQSQSLL